MKDIYEIEIYGELCCDDCNNIIHNHMDCPICKNDYASTNIYYEIWEFDKDDVLTCEECKTNFKPVDKAGYNEKWRVN